MYTQPLVIQLYRQICWFPVRRSASSAQVYPPACTWEKTREKVGIEPIELVVEPSNMVI